LLKIKGQLLQFATYQGNVNGCISDI